LNRMMAAVTRLSAAARVCWFSCPREAVTRLALVELAGHETAQRRVVEPAQGEQGPLNKADLAEGGSDAELLPVPWTPR
jgi:hypothetical protein